MEFDNKIFAVILSQRDLVIKIDKFYMNIFGNQLVESYGEAFLRNNIKYINIRTII